MLEAIDAGGFQCFPGGESADFLFFPALGVKARQAVFAAERVRFQLLGEAIAPAGRDFVDGGFATAFAVTVEGVEHGR